MSRARLQVCNAGIAWAVALVWMNSMLLRLTDHIRACYARAARAEEAARLDPSARSHHLEMAKRWAHLARSYEFVESLERFLLNLDKAGGELLARQHGKTEWQSISTAPFDRDLRLAVIDQGGVAHALVFPCRQVPGGWIKAETKARLEINPTHWQEWVDGD